MSSSRSILSLKERLDGVLDGFVSDHRGFFGVLKREGKERAIKYQVAINAIADEDELIRKVYLDIKQEEGKGALDTSSNLRAKLALALLGFLRDRNVASFENNEIPEGLEHYLNKTVPDMLKTGANPGSYFVLEALDKFIRKDNDSRRSHEQGMPNVCIVKRKTLKETLVEFLDHYVQTNDSRWKAEGRQRADEYKQFITSSDQTEYDLSLIVFNDVFEEDGAGRLQTSSRLREALKEALCEYAGLRAQKAKKLEEINRQAVVAGRHSGILPPSVMMEREALDAVLKSTFEHRVAFRP